MPTERLGALGTKRVPEVLGGGGGVPGRGLEQATLRWSRNNTAIATGERGQRAARAGSETSKAEERTTRRRTAVAGSCLRRDEGEVVGVGGEEKSTR